MIESLAHRVDKLERTAEKHDEMLRGGLDNAGVLSSVKGIEGRIKTMARECTTAADHTRASVAELVVKVAELHAAVESLKPDPEAEKKKAAAEKEAREKREARFRRVEAGMAMALVLLVGILVTDVQTARGLVTQLAGVAGYELPAADAPAPTEPPALPEPGEAP